MNQKDSGIMLTVAFVAGLYGGLLSNYFFASNPALAQKTPQIPKSISAEEFRLVDANGKTRAILHIMAKDKTAPIMRDYDDIINNAPGPHLTFFDNSGHPVVSLGSFYGGDGALVFRDHNITASQTLMRSSELTMTDAGTTGVGLNVTPAVSSIFVAGPGNKTSLSLNAGPSASFLEMVSSGNDRISRLHLMTQNNPASVLEAGGLFLQVSRTSGKEPKDVKVKEGGTISLALTGDGDPGLRFDDKEGITRASLGKTEHPVSSVSSLVLFGPDRTVLWSAP